jgi:hypothetical protein
MRLAEVPAATVPDAKHVNHLAFDGEEYSIKMRSMAVEQLPHFKRDGGILRGQPAAAR